MPSQVQSALVGAIVTVAVMMGLLLRRRRRSIDLSFSMLCIVLIGWFVAAPLDTWVEGEIGIRVELAMASLVPVLLIRLFGDLLRENGRPVTRLLAPVAPIALVSFVLAASLGGVLVVQAFGLTFVVAAILIACRALVVSADAEPGTVDYARRLYLAVGAAFVTVLCATLEIPFLARHGTALGHLAVMTYVFFLSQVILRDRLLDLNEFLARMAVLGLLAILFAGISGLLVNLGDSPSSRSFSAVFAVIIFLTLYEPLKDRLERKVTEVFFRERHRFSQRLSELRLRMQHGVLDPQAMATIVVTELYDSRRATHAAVYLLEPAGRAFVLQAHRGPEPAPRVDRTEYLELYKLIHESTGTLSVEEMERGVTKDPLSPSRRTVADSMRAVSADLLLPFRSGTVVLGFLALRDDRSLEPYASSEIAGLETIADTAATFVWNSKLAERLREQERLAAIGAMAAGLAHEIRNPLGAIKGAAEYLDPRSQQGEDGEFLQVIIEETNRLNYVVSQFLDYARPFRGNFEPTDLNLVARKTVKLLEAQGFEGGRVQVDLDPNLPSITADREQLKQVILNLLLNALDASEPSRHPVVIRTLRSGEDIELHVRDRGSGISPEDLDRIFIPFFTTKNTGTGLGLAVCQRIVLNHGGAIRVASRPDEGTQFVVQLPITKEVRRAPKRSSRCASKSAEQKARSSLHDGHAATRRGIADRTGRAPSAVG
ncbi:MAG: hypothetical protein HC923_08220, partial [Myxococcales bacterium]|nr:hypothetical protein [Myxococcales bacterium]